MGPCSHLRAPGFLGPWPPRGPWQPGVPDRLGAPSRLGGARMTWGPFESRWPLLGEILGIRACLQRQKVPPESPSRGFSGLRAPLGARSNDENFLRKVPPMTTVGRPSWVKWRPPSPCPLRHFVSTLLIQRQGMPIFSILFQRGLSTRKNCHKWRQFAAVTAGREKLMS